MSEDEKLNKSVDELDTSLDTKVYPNDYVSSLFNSIDWDSRVKPENRMEGVWVSPESWDTHSYAMKYLNYQLEEGQIDLSNPFHIEEGNKLRSRLVRKNKRKTKEEIEELNLVKEGVHEVNKTKNENEEDGDYLDEYGNIRDDTMESKDKDVEMEDDSNNVKVDSNQHTKVDRGRGRGRGRGGWRDLDQEEGKPGRIGTRSEKVEKQKENTTMVPPHLVFPRSSSLTWTEQDRFLYNQFLVGQGKLHQGCGNQWIFYQNFLELVQEERAEYIDFARSYSKGVEKFPLNPEFHRYVEEHRRNRLVRPLSMTRWWDKVKEVRLAGVDPMQSADMRFQQTLIEMGRIPKATIPEMIRHQKGGKKAVHCPCLPTKYTRLVHKVPTAPDIAPGSLGQSRGEQRKVRGTGNEDSESVPITDSAIKIDTNKYLHKVPVPQDPNAEKIAQLVVPNVIISSSGLSCLMDNHRSSGYQRTWEIPITVRTYTSSDAQKQITKSVVFFGKPLLSRAVTVADMSQVAHKVAVRVNLLNPDWSIQKHPKFKQEKRDNKMNSSEVIQKDDDLFGGADIEDLEVFGSEVKKKVIEDEGLSSSNIESSVAPDIEKDLDVDILQYDGGNDSDSSDEDGGLVINEGENVDDNTVNSKRKEEDIVVENESTTINNAITHPTEEVSTGQRRSRRSAAVKSQAAITPHSSQPRDSRRKSNRKLDIATEQKLASIENPLKCKVDSSSNSSAVEDTERVKKPNLIEPQTQLPELKAEKPKEESESSDEDDSDDESARVLLAKKLNLSSQIISVKDGTDSYCKNVEQEKIGNRNSSDTATSRDEKMGEKGEQFLGKQDNTDKSISKEESDSSSDESDDESARNLLAKKLMLKSQVSTPTAALNNAAITDGGEIKDQTKQTKQENVGDLKEEVSESEKHVDLKQRKQSPESDERKSKDSESSDEESDDESARALLAKKLNLSSRALSVSDDKEEKTDMEVDEQDSKLDHSSLLEETFDTNKKGVEKICKTNEDTVSEKKSCNFSKQDIFGSEDSESDDSNSLSPRKKAKKLSSSESESETALKSTLSNLDRGEADIQKVKTRIKREKCMKEIIRKKNTRDIKEAAERDERVMNRNDEKPKVLEETPVGDLISPDKLKTKKKLNNIWEICQEPVEVKKKEEHDNHEDKNRSTTSKPCQSEDILDSLLSKQQSMLKVTPSETDSKQNTQNYKGDVINILAPGIGSSNQYKFPPSHTNVSYRLWRLADKSNPESGLNVVIRSKVHGVTAENKVVQPSAKLETRPLFGGQQVSHGQLSREWISTLIRPNSVLKRVRVKHDDSQILMMEERSLSQLGDDGRSIGCDPAKQLANVFNIMKEVSQLPAGEYLLQHTPKTGPFCKLLSASTKSSPGSYDLHTPYTTLDPGHTVSDTVTHLPVDPGLLTPWHEVQRRIPGTFEPLGQRPSNNQHRGGRGRGRGNHRGRGRGGRGRSSGGSDGNN